MRKRMSVTYDMCAMTVSYKHPFLAQAVVYVYKFLLMHKYELYRKKKLPLFAEDSVNLGQTHCFGNILN